jgi:hypothetical protein
MVVESRWRCEDERWGRVSVNYQVRSYFLVFFHFDYSPSSFFLFDLYVFLPSHLFSLPCFFIFLLLQYLLISSTFGIIMDEKISPYILPPELTSTPHRQYLVFSPQCLRPYNRRRLLLPHQSFSTFSSTPPIIVRQPYRSRVLHLWTTSSSGNSNNVTLRRRSLFHNPIDYSPPWPIGKSNALSIRLFLLYIMDRGAHRILKRNERRAAPAVNHVLMGTSRCCMFL